MSLRVVEPGLYTLVVDRGRPRSRSLGVPLGGAADRTSLALGNALLGNPPDAAALEISLAGPTLQATIEVACVLYGAPFDLGTDRRSPSTGKTFTLGPGETLRIGGAREGMRAYLCVRGGLQTSRILDSRSALAPLKAGDELPCEGGRTPARFLRLPPTPDDEPGVLRYLEGPQHDWFNLDSFEAPEYRVRPESNRMGLRLAGPPVPLPSRELVSEPVCPGAVQVTRDGQCIVLGVDGQTIGGYPKVAQVVAADLDRLGQLRPGEQLRFRRVSLPEAEELYARRRAWLRGLLTRAREVALGSG
jgi:5-oxoprolinase (ATP-hydrolysing) subunit C